MAIRKSGYVALFDVLGFSDRVMRGAFEGLDRYIDTVVNITQPHQQIGTILFSDTVVLYTFDESDNSFDSIIHVTSSLFYELLNASIPVRGAISHGDFTRSDNDAHGTVIAGRPIIDAHHYESRLQWIGIMLTPSLLERRADVSANSCAFDAGGTEGELFAHAVTRIVLQPCSMIPLADGPVGATDFDGFAIVPVSSTVRTLKEIRDSIDRSRTTLNRLKQLAPEARSQAKYQRSLQFLQNVRFSFVETLGHRI